MMTLELSENKNPGSETGDFLRPDMVKRTIPSRLNSFNCLRYLQLIESFYRNRFDTKIRISCFYASKGEWHSPLLPIDPC